MRFSVIIFFILFSLVLINYGYCSDDDQWISTQKKLYGISDKAELNALLKEVHRRFASLNDRIRAIALLRLGTPYVGGCLGEETPPDTGPLFRLDVADCTVFVITSVALAHKETWKGAREMMKVLNYHNPPVVGKEVVSYNNRIHFTYDRLHGCPYFRDITDELLPEGELSRATVTLNRKSDGSRLLNIPWEKKVTARYIPSSRVDALLCSRLPEACGVAFVREKNFKIGVVVTHEGIIIDKKWLIHANSISKKVMKTDLCGYMRDNSDYFDGLIISEFR